MGAHYAKARITRTDTLMFVETQSVHKLVKLDARVLVQDKGS